LVHMGLFTLKTTVQTSIDFYSDLEVSVTHDFMNSVSEEEEDMRLVYLVAFYYSKMLYNLESHPSVESLMSYVQNIYDQWKKDFKENPNQEYRPKLPKQYAHLVEKRESKVIKTFKADLNKSRRGTYSIWTKIPTLEPNKYIPPSVVALIQYAINNLHEPMQVTFLIMTLGAMNHYYREQSDHTAMRHVTAAPHYGVQGASKLMVGLSNQ